MKTTIGALLKKNLCLLLVLLLLVLTTGGCGGSGGSAVVDDVDDGDDVDYGANDVNVKVGEFRLADWSEQVWQQSGKPDGEIHPLQPLKFEITLSASRPKETNDDTVWVALSFTDGAKATPMGDFTAREDEPTNDPNYIGFFQIDVKEGENDLSFSVYPETTARPGKYGGIQAQVFLPGKTGYLTGKTLFHWVGDVELLDVNEVSPVDSGFAVVTINANPPVEDGEYGFDFSSTAVSDPTTGFERLFEGDTPVTQLEDREGVTRRTTGYFVEMDLAIEILTLSGLVHRIEVTEQNGLRIWDFNAGDFVKTYEWIGDYLTNPEDALLDGAMPKFAEGFKRGENGIALIVGGWGDKAPADVSQVRLTLKAYDAAGKPLTGNVFLAGDETIRRQPPNVRRAPDFDYPFILPGDESRIDLPMYRENRIIDFSRTEFVWKETMERNDATYGDAWKKILGDNVEYKGEGKRYIYGDDRGNKSTFAARAYVLYEEYTGIARRMPRDSEYSVHDVMTMAGTRMATEVAVWLVDRKFSIFFAGAEFRNDLHAKIRTQKESGTSYNRIVDNDTAMQEHHAMVSEFNSKVEVLGMVLISTPLSATNTQTFEGYETGRDILTKTQELAVPAKFFILEVRAGVRFTFFVRLTLMNEMWPERNAVVGQGTVALGPGVNASGFVEGGVNIVVASAHLGFRLTFIELSVKPGYNMLCELKWSNESDGDAKVVAGWKNYPSINLDVRTLDGEVYVKYSIAFFIRGTYVFFKWRGLQTTIPIWEGQPTNRPDQFMTLSGY